MTLLHEAAELKKMDTRVVERHLDRGVIQSKELDKSLKELPDDAQNAEYVSIESLADTDGDSR